MQAVTFEVVRSSDREMLEALKAMRADADNAPQCQKFVFSFLSDGDLEVPGEGIASNSQLENLVGDHVRIFRNVRVETALGNINCQRHEQGHGNADNTKPFDRISISPRQQNPPPPEQFSVLVAFAQKHLGRFSINALTTYLGEDARRHFEARDVALARLEELVANLTREVEDARRRRDAELDAKEQRLDEKYRAKHEELETKIKERQSDLDKSKAALDQREERLNLQAAKGERRQVRQDLKKTLREWSEKFEITESTKRLRLIIHALSISLLVIFATAAGVYLYQSIQLTDTAQFLTMSIKQGLFTALFVATGIFYARWNTHWFHRRANEEFRLKRMELDFDRASWFVELLFQWQEEFKDQPIPPELIERLTAHLFTTDNGDAVPQHPYEALGSALLGASTKVRLGPSGAEVEFDRKGIKRLRKDADE